MPIRVFIISDFLILLDGLSNLINSHPERFLLVNCAKSYQQVFEKIAKIDLDIIILDIDGYVTNILSLIEGFTHITPAKIVLVTRLNNTELEDKAMICGVKGIIRHDTAPELFLSAIEKVNEGEVWVNRSAMERMLIELTRINYKSSNSISHKVTALTKRELEIIVLIARCNDESGKVIADKLNISQNTLRNHLSSIYEKLGVANRKGLLSLVLKYDLVQ